MADTTVGGPVPPAADAEPQTLDGPTALRLLREVVAERPDHVYEPPGEGGNCVYVLDGEPSCVVGQVLSRAGYPIDTLRRLDEYGAITYATGHVKEIRLDPAAVSILGRAQVKQDQRDPWSVALAAAERRAATLGVSA